MRSPRRLSRDEAVLWACVAQTVAPLNPPRNGKGDRPQAGGGAQAESATPRSAAKKFPVPLHQASLGPPPRAGEVPKPPRPLDRHGLDASWDKKLGRGLVQPDFTLDLHGCGLEAAHARLDAGLSQAIALGARVVLVIAGRPRPVEAADRGGARGAIRAKLLDWLAHGAHAGRIAAVRPAHRRHGGAGAVYLVLRRKG